MTSAPFIFINEVMAIRRCPYCKAIIDETDKYCNNCGTQLLFPEDENIEEDIPGDKIIEEEEEEEEEEESEEEEFETAEEKEFEEASWEEEEEREEEEEEEEREQAEEKEEWPEEKLEEEEFRSEGDVDKKYRVTLENDELIFKTKELGEVTPAAAEEEEVDEAEREEVKIEMGERVPETGEVLPPWASEIKEVHPFALEREEGEEFEERELEKEKEGEGEVEEKPAEKMPDSGIGIPERITQTGSLFADTEALEKPTTKRFEGIFLEAREEERAAPYLPFSLKMKSKFVDLIFITAIWLISLWFTARVIDVSFFRLFTKSPLPILGFYLILLLLYFFLFLYFLGETLGDHYFSGED